MSNHEKIAAYAALQMLVNDFFRALDEWRTDDVIAMFAEGGEWVRPSGVLTTPQQIRAELDGRPAERTSRHLMSNLRIVDHEHDRYRIAYNLITYSGPTAAPGPIDMQGPTGVLDCEDLVVKRADGWRFIRRAATPIFRRAG